MGVPLRDVLMARLGELRYEPTQKRIRATLGEHTVVDTTRAVLVWEPKRIVPSYAVPDGDIDAEVVARPAPPGPTPPAAGAPQLAGRTVWDPSVPFSAHSAGGQPVAVRAAGREAAGLRLHDAALGGYVILDFDGFDAWFEEDERNVGHPRDPFHRVDIVHSSRHVRVEHGGQALAESDAPYLLFEPPLPVRFYFAPGDVAMERLRPSPTTTLCAYKGQASYWSVDGEDDIAWTYREPLREAAEVTGRIAFFNERLDIVVDGTLLERPVTPWSRRAG